MHELLHLLSTFRSMASTPFLKNNSGWLLLELFSEDEINNAYLSQDFEDFEKHYDEPFYNNNCLTK